MKVTFRLTLLLSFALSSSAWSSCGKLCEFEWWDAEPSVEDLKNVLEGEIDINAADPTVGLYPIHFGAWLGSLEQVKILLKSGADPLVGLKSSNLSFHNRTPLHFVNASKDNLIDKASIFISAGIDVNAVNGKGRTALHLAHYSKSTAYVKFLLDMKADVNAKDENGYSPLCDSVHSTPEIVKLLIDKGANVSDVNKWGQTPLHLAVREYEGINKSDPEIIKILIQSGADVNAKDDANIRPLHVAVKDGNIEAVTVLLKAGAKVNARDQDGYTALHETFDIEKMKLLIKSGADLRAKSQWGSTPLHVIALKGTLEQVKLLLTTTARNDINSKDEDGVTPLLMANMRSGDLVKALIQAGADVNARNKWGESPLHGPKVVNMSPDSGAIEALLAADARVDARDIRGRTPLHEHAKHSDNEQGIILLLDYGADPNAKDDSGKTPWDYIQENDKLKNTDAYWKLNDARFH